ncbi:unnamed protein product, partial [Ectocarpus sp. 4 AP-2014]
DTEDRQQITAHVDEVRAVIGRMGHTLYMARVRSELRAAIKTQGQKRIAAALDCEQKIGDGQTIAGGLMVNAREAGGPETPEGMENGEGRKAAVGLRCCRDEDTDIKSPRERYLRRMAAVCLQRHARGRPQRRVFRELVRPALHIFVARGPPQISPFGIGDRRAILLARFMAILDACNGLRDLVPTLSSLTCRSRKHRQRNRAAASAPLFGSDADMTSTDVIIALPSSSHPAAKTEVVVQRAIASDDTERPDQGPHSREGQDGASAEARNSGECTPGRTAKGGTQDTRGNNNSSEAAQTAERETAIVLWALRDAAARVVQEEMRCFARRKRWLLLRTGQRQREPGEGEHGDEGRSMSTVGVESPTGTGMVYQPEVAGGLPWAVAAGVSPIALSSASFSSSCARATTGRTTMAGTSSATGESTGMTMTADTRRSLATRATVGENKSKSADDSWASSSPTPNRSTHTACSTVSSARSSPATPRTTTAARTPASGGYTGRTTTAGTTASSSATRRTKDSACGESPETSSSLVSPTTSRSPHTAGSAVSTPWTFQQSTRTRTQGDSQGDPAPELAWTWENERGEDEPPDGKHTWTDARRTASRAVRWPILPSEERKKRENEAHLRRNKSRLGVTLRGLANLECQGNFVLPEIIRMQRLFRARRTRRIYERGQAHREAHQTEWKAKTARERQEREARWKSSMSRLKFEHPPNQMKQLGCVAGLVARVVSGSSNVYAGGVAHRAVFAELTGKAMRTRRVLFNCGQDAPYANASWSLAVAYDVGSWRGGLRQRYYFGRLVRFLAHRRSRRAALRERVTARMAKRLQAWATVLAKEKRSLVCEIKARAPAEIVGAHLRFLSRTGTWERLLLDLNQIHETAVSQREQAVGLLSEQVAPETRGVSGQGRTTHSARTPTASPHRFPRARAGSSHNIHQRTSSRHTSSRQGGSPDTWADGRFPVARGAFSAEKSGRKAGGSPGHLAFRENVAGSRHDSRRARLTAESRRRAGLTEIVDERILRCLHPWIVTLLARSALQFVPSVPHKHRIGFRMDDTNKVGALAETQLTRRYWRLLEGVSDAVSLVGAAKIEAATLAAEAGEWRLLLGFAHHLVSKGHVGLPCTLPALPRNSSIKGPTSSIKVLGMISKQANHFLAPVRRKRAENAPGLEEAAPAAQYQQQAPAAIEQHGQHHRPSARLYATGPMHQGGQGQATSVPKWFSAHKTLCETCWALRTGASAAGGSKCQRCGRTHVRGFSHEISKRGGDDTADPVPWQQFSQVKESLDLFIVHAAYACVLHPSPLNNATVAAGLGGGLGWWDGGNTEQAWWRAVCGGKEAAKRLRDDGCDTVGKLYTYVQGSAVGCSSSSSSLAGCGDGALPKKARSCTKKLRRLINDEDLATKIASLLRRLISAFEELRKQHRWPTVSKAAIDRTMRRLQLPHMAGTAPTP